jgi:tRNA A37 threonylcarbamoyladenosine biosynthesis protein TsaE
MTDTKKKLRVLLEDAHSVLSRYHAPVRTAARMLDIASDIKDVTSPFGLANIAFNGLVTAIDAGNYYPKSDQNYFVRRAWTPVCGDSNPHLLLTLFTGERRPVGVHMHTAHRGDHAGMETSVTLLGGIPVGLLTNPKNNLLLGCYCKPEDLDRLWLVIDRKFHELYPNIVRLEAVEQSGNKLASFGDSPPYRLVAEDKPLHVSELSERLAAQISRFNARGMSRSLMLHGRPGTGKTTVAHAVIHKLGYRTLRGTSERYRLPYEMLRMTIKTLRMEALLIDDIDRLATTDEMLEFMEWAKEHLKVVIYTANNEREIDVAMKRPGRIDERVLVDALPDAMVRELLGPDNQDFLSRVLTWPIAYINEFVNRRLDDVSPELAEEWIQELESAQHDKEGKKLNTPPNWSTTEIVGIPVTSSHA